MKAPQRYPLAWPAGKPRTKASARRRGIFIANKTRPSILDAFARLEDQVQRLGGIYPVLSSNLELRLDGRPRSDTKVTDPGVCLYFSLKGQSVSMPCDTFDEVAQNILGIANHIEAVRRIESYGVGTAAESLQAFTALAPPGPTLPTRRPWHVVLGLNPDHADEESIRVMYRMKAKVARDDAALLELNLARDEALAAIKVRA